MYNLCIIRPIIYSCIVTIFGTPDIFIDTAVVNKYWINIFVFLVDLLLLIRFQTNNHYACLEKVKFV